MTMRSPNKNEINNLELYLNDVYGNKCVFKAEPGEIEFIQAGIKIIVQKIVHLVLENISLTAGEEEVLLNLEEAYFPIKKKQVKTAKSSIIQVGSISEGTKNSFPDEFDIIFPIYLVKTYAGWCPRTKLLSKAYEQIKTVTTRPHTECLNHICPNETLNVTKSLHFDRYVREHGPASVLRFIYKNGLGDEKYIHVDLVPAIKITVLGDQRDWYEKFNGKYFNPKLVSLCSKIMSDKNYLEVDGRISFTESESHFMRNILSKKHSKVYRILKILINGHGDGEILNLYFRTDPHSSEKGYSSHKIKTMMFHHHHECKNPGEETIGDCVKQVLEEMCKDSNNENHTVWGTDSILQTQCLLLPYLEKLLEGLKSIQTSEDSYDYEKLRMKSVSKRYLDALKEKEYLDRDKQGNAVCSRSKL
ncbi:uncharacterized protein LOC123562777 [Mercenaria mercenaria]|uniref:uncharacterized protein LOC123562777 n=1 Tax=Mercenaria mercenaria TaxID=6596 RepID=UPI00234F1730|nr:uncharacterized protein LOC123562777 [Mercenaria mercenaria]